MYSTVSSKPIWGGVLKSRLEKQRCTSLLLKHWTWNFEKWVPLLAQSQTSWLAPTGLWLQEDANYSRDLIQKEPHSIYFLGSLVISKMSPPRMVSWSSMLRTDAEDKRSRWYLILSPSETGICFQVGGKNSGPNIIIVK